jgi:cell division protein FtsN
MELERKVPGVQIVKALVGGETYYRVRVGSFASRTEAQGTAERLAALGYRVLVMESAALP